MRAMKDSSFKGVSDEYKQHTGLWDADQEQNTKKRQATSPSIPEPGRGERQEKFRTITEAAVEKLKTEARAKEERAADRRRQLVREAVVACFTTLRHQARASTTELPEALVEGMPLQPQHVRRCSQGQVRLPSPMDALLHAEESRRAKLDCQPVGSYKRQPWSLCSAQRLRSSALAVQARLAVKCR